MLILQFLFLCSSDAFGLHFGGQNRLNMDHILDRNVEGIFDCIGITDGCLELESGTRSPELDEGTFVGLEK